MFHLWNRLQRADEPGAPSLAKVITACAAYSLVLIVVVLLFGVSPDAQHPVVPPGTHQHGVHPHQVPSETELLPNHQHPDHGSLGGPERHKKVTPRELSLAKW